MILIISMENKFLNPYKSPPLNSRSLYLRKLIIRAFEGGMRGHLGSSMSLVEIMSALYDNFLSYNSNNPLWIKRDRFILSKGHGCLAQYALLADKGFISLEDLDKFCHHNGILGGHPEKSKIPGVEFSTGALGHGLPVGVGMAIAAKINKQKHKIIVVTGDGEINEGSVWEAALSASKNKVDNLIWMIDYNKFQSYGQTKNVVDLEPLNQKITSFGFNLLEVDGHDISMIEKALNSFSYNSSIPNAIICHTVKGKGFSFAEHNENWHHKSNLKPEEINAMYACLEK